MKARHICRYSGAPLSVVAALSMVRTPLDCLDLEPVVRPFARSVRGVHAFGDDALEVVLSTRCQHVGDVSMQTRDGAAPIAFERERVQECATRRVGPVND